MRYLLLVLVMLLNGCVTTGPDAATGIIGAWQTEVAGYPVTVRYDAGLVQVGDASPQPYTIDGSDLRVGDEVRTVSIKSGVMMQYNPLTETSQRFERIN